jgi:hypothetical protein
MFSKDVIAVTVSYVQYSDNGTRPGLSCTPCYYKGEEFTATFTEETLPANSQCARCNRLIGRFVPREPMNPFQYAEMARNLALLDPEDLINLISRTLLDRPDMTMLANLETGHLACQLDFTLKLDQPDSYPAEIPREVKRAFRISVTQADDLAKQ